VRRCVQYRSCRNPRSVSSHTAKQGIAARVSSVRITILSPSQQISERTTLNPNNLSGANRSPTTFLLRCRNRQKFCA